MVAEYDNALFKNWSKLKIVPTPLLCWDFFEQYFSDAFLMKNIQNQWNDKIDFENAVKNQKKEIIVTDKNFKIIFATRTIVDMNGYNAKEIVGRSPGFFQGAGTCAKTKNTIRKALSNLEPFKEVVLNYKKNGQQYWCEIDAYPKFDINGNFVNYIAYERLVA